MKKRMLAMLLCVMLLVPALAVTVRAVSYALAANVASVWLGFSLLS